MSKIPNIERPKLKPLIASLLRFYPLGGYVIPPVDISKDMKAPAIFGHTDSCGFIYMFPCMWETVFFLSNKDLHYLDNPDYVHPLLGKYFNAKGYPK